MIKQLEYFYDGQQRRFIEQIVRAFSGFQYQTGWRNGEPPQLRMVPCRHAQTSRLVASIMRNNSENTLNTVPMITVWQNGLTGRRSDLQSQTHIDTRMVTERKIDPVTGLYTAEQGNRYTVERLMALPMMMSIQVDIWTSNLDQKYQLIEQIMTVMYPDFEIQNSDNALDWTAKTMLQMDDDVQWGSRTIPIGTENEIDVTTLNFKLPMWLTPPAKVTQQRRIDTIVTNIAAPSPIGEGQRIDEIVTDITDQNRLTRSIVTPGNHWIEVGQGYLTLLGPKGSKLDEQGNPYSWAKLLEEYGALRPTESEIRIKRANDIESDQEVVGTIQFDGLHPNRLVWQIDPDTLPVNTQRPVDAAIDPLRFFPGTGLPGPINGQRYIVINDVANSVAWGSLSARTNDIIEYRNGGWEVAFQAAATTEVQHVLNLKSSRQLRWTGEEWVLAIDGEYSPGYWRVHL